MIDGKVTGSEMSIQQHSTELWTVSGGLSVIGFELGCRMTVVRLRNGKLWLHSPVKLTEQVQTFLNGLAAPISDVVAPNTFHHLFVKPYLERFGARLWGVRHIKTKRADLSDIQVLDGKSPAHPWGNEFQVKLLKGRKFQELVFLHIPSRTLVLTDLAFNLPLEQNRGLRAWLLRKAGVTAPFGPSIVERKIFIPKSPELRQDISEIAAWDFEKIIIAHGEIIESDGAKIFNEAFQYYIN